MADELPGAENSSISKKDKSSNSETSSSVAPLADKESPVKDEGVGESEGVGEDVEPEPKFTLGPSDESSESPVPVPLAEVSPP